MNVERCSIPGCERTPLSCCGLCAAHFDQLDRADAHALAVAWRTYVLSDAIGDAERYTVRLRQALLQLDGPAAVRGPVQLRLVK